MNDRTKIAARCLQGMLANPSLVSEFGPTARASDAVKHADALLKELSPITGEDVPHQTVREWIRNEVLEEAANLVEGHYDNPIPGTRSPRWLASQIRALKKSEVR